MTAVQQEIEQRRKEMERESRARLTTLNQQCVDALCELMSALECGRVVSRERLAELRALVNRRYEAVGAASIYDEPQARVNA